MNLSQLLACACIALFAVAADWPGPKQTEMENGVEVWKAKAREDRNRVYTYKVNDLNARGARPKLVYNCHKVPALCANARTRLNGETKTTRHYDADISNGRHDARRDQACPNRWIESHQCPEPNQPEDFWYYITKLKKFGQRKIEMMQDKQPDGTETQDPVQFGQAKITYDPDGTIKKTWSMIGARFTCDEWPAASWIEGGQGANTYCSPTRLCGKKKVRPLNTEQDWQGQAHGTIKEWYDSFYHQWARNIQDDHDVNYEIFKFDFEIVNDPGSKFGTWLEALGRKRYCYPKGNIDNDCQKEWDEDPDDLFRRR
ncbi:hypothetical protein P168DRAFT_326241 [Aspergillus campestris IBT 28561]|uniref:Uncharacterized protein n=1 Tax=Aspergillus campestris (strain IBT 28561) TaxID=1392248 RepID=A0A2I1D7T6_ASPC2|nr:uncharacterized protein P168DRAFT_326241 [Aspergillus campestris IBT 28561]PKY05941.1 hypothetical protein P168DRAFT_326241 [Aspergillus campestris IBT 28561]